MRKYAWALFLLGCVSVAPAAVMNVEFEFTPFTGDPAREQEVTAVPGEARVLINNVPVIEQVITAEKLPVSAEHVVAAAVSVPMSSVGPVIRRGRNKLRIEFVPNDSQKTYRALLRWEEVTDQALEEAGAAGEEAASKLAHAQVDDRSEVQGKVVFEREFTADFAFDLPWHHYPPITSLGEEDKQKLAAVLKKRAEWFKPDFSALYQALEDNESLKAGDVRKAQCLESAYRAGVRVTAPEVGDLDFTTTGGPEVVVTKKKGALFGLDETMYALVKDEETRMCAALALSMIYAGKMIAVRKSDGTWEIVN